jgi:hypothetical protein
MNIETEIIKFKEEINKHNYKTSNTNLIYLRLSALDNSIEDETSRIKDTIDKLKADFNKLLETYSNLKENGFRLFVEVKSAYKNSTREVFIDLYSNYLFQDITSVKDLLEEKEIKEEKNLYISSYDRLSRVFFYSLTFQLLRKLRNINIFTLLEEEKQFEIRNKEVKNKENLEQTMFVFQLMMFSSMASKHSEDLSVKIKKRVDRTGKITISSKTGNKWGVEKTISDEMRKKIKDRYKRFTAKEISEQEDIYQTKNNTKCKIALNTILKIIQESKH